MAEEKPNEMPEVVHRHKPRAMEGVNIILVGVGGTGGYTASYLIRYLGGIRQDLRSRVSVTLIDPDTFSIKNLGRQLCTEKDIGKNKAEVISMRYTSLHKITESPVAYIPEAVKRIEDITSLIKLDQTNIIIDCVDKTTPRNIIHKALKSVYDSRQTVALYLISAGNEEYTGQVAWGAALRHNGTPQLFSPKTRFESEPYMFSVPMPYKKMPRLMDMALDKAEAALSCAERAASNIQTLNANQTAATIAFNFASTIISAYEARVASKPITDLTCAMVSFDSQKNLFKSEVLTETYIKGELF